MQTNQLPPSPVPRRDPRLLLTDALQALKKDDSYYGILVSQHLFDMLELRSASVRTEVPIMNMMPIAVDKNFKLQQWEKVATRDEWLARAQGK